MVIHSTSRSARQKVRMWCHDILDSMSKLDEDKMFKYAEEALKKAKHDTVRQTLVELSIGSPTPGVTAALIRAAIRFGSTQLGRAAADLLIDIKDAESAYAIIKECLESEDTAIRVRAVEAMETLEGEHVFELLQKTLSAEDDNVRTAGVNSLGLVIGSKYHPLKSNMLEALSDSESNFFKLLTETPDLSLKRDFAKVLGFADSDDVLPLLQEFVNDPDTQTRREAMLALAANGTSRAMEITEEKLDDEDELVVTFALDSLASKIGRDSEHMLECIKKVLDHPNEAVRRNAVMMLNWFPQSKIEKLIKKTARDPDFEVQRSAQSLLRSMDRELAPLGLESADTGSSGENTLRIWEVGNVGMESDRSKNKSTVDAETVATDEIVDALTKQAVSGDISKRCHAITELCELEDISDSPVLRKALYDDNESLRSRAARALDFTRDAGLAAKVLSEHPDDLIRRRAVDALTDNPSGRSKGTSVKAGITFSSERTQGMELFSCFLKALDDNDEGVIQSACYGIGYFVGFDCPIPVRETVEKLEEIASGKDLSSLTRDCAAEVIDEINEAELGEPLVKAVDGMLAEIAALTEIVQRLKWDQQQQTYSFQTNDKDAVVWELIDELQMEPQSARQLAQAATENSNLSEELADSYAGAVSECIITVFNAVEKAAEALLKLGENKWGAKSEEWQTSLADFNVDILDTAPAFKKHSKRIARYLNRAILMGRTAAMGMSDSWDADKIEEFLNSEDDWMTIAALNSLDSKMSREQKKLLRSLIQKHKADQNFDAVLSVASIGLIKENDKEALDVLFSVIGRCKPHLRNEILYNLTDAAQDESVLKMIKNRAEAEKNGNSLALICMKMAVLAGKGETHLIENDSAEEALENKDLEYRYAFHALHAMDNNYEAAETLKTALRNGEPSERVPAAHYLGIARVESATSIFASVSDQVGSEWHLRALCAGLMVRKGHRQGIGWFKKSAGQGGVSVKGIISYNLARSISDIIPMMLKCHQVNLGRFV